MKVLLQRSVRIIDTATVWSGRFCSLLILPIIGLIAYEAFSRYFLGRPTIWAMEISTLIFGVYMIWACAPSILHKGQVAMDIFYQKWSPRTRAIADSLTFIMIFIFCAAMLHESVLYAVDSWQRNEHSRALLEEPLYHWRAVLALGVLLFVLQALSAFVKNLWLAATGEELL